MGHRSPPGERIRSTRPVGGVHQSVRRGTSASFAGDDSLSSRLIALSGLAGPCLRRSPPLVPQRRSAGTTTGASRKVSSPSALPGHVALSGAGVQYPGQPRMIPLRRWRAAAMDPVSLQAGATTLRPGGFPLVVGETRIRSPAMAAGRLVRSLVAAARTRAGHASALSLVRPMFRYPPCGTPWLGRGLPSRPRSWGFAPFAVLRLSAARVAVSGPIPTCL